MGRLNVALMVLLAPLIIQQVPKIATKGKLIGRRTQKVGEGQIVRVWEAGDMGMEPRRRGGGE